MDAEDRTERRKFGAVFVGLMIILSAGVVYSSDIESSDYSTSYNVISTVVTFALGLAAVIYGVTNPIRWRWAGLCMLFTVFSIVVSVFEPTVLGRLAIAVVCFLTCVTLSAQRRSQPS